MGEKNEEILGIEDVQRQGNNENMAGSRVRGRSDLRSMLVPMLYKHTRVNLSSIIITLPVHYEVFKGRNSAPISVTSAI